jgi:hypothetical protein
MQETTSLQGKDIIHSSKEWADVNRRPHGTERFQDDSVLPILCKTLHMLQDYYDKLKAGKDAARGQPQRCMRRTSGREIQPELHAPAIQSNTYSSSPVMIH